MFIGEEASKNDAGLLVILSDVKRAYVYAAAHRELYADIPREDLDWPLDAIGRLNFVFFVGCDAAKVWQEFVAKHLLSVGLTRGKSNPCVYYKEK